ncbi:MAG: RNA pyrophosphohydrolase [Alphaproteobacteria bacterium]|nr:RNA pyrophosphohydrolase [Alphaproteobacteria bacterium]
MSELYRSNVGIVVFNRRKKVLWCERKDIPGQWQFPQGGIEENETFREAAFRELKEETSVTSVEEVAEIASPMLYDFPKPIAERFNKRGQAMNWVLYRFTGNDDEINLNTAEPEFSHWRWEDIDEAIKKIVDFKRDVYQKMAAAFKPYL